MKENCIITIEGSFSSEGEQDSVSLTTVGAFYKKNGKYYICYKESEATGFEGYTTTIKVWDNAVSLIRHNGKNDSNLIIEKGAVNLCNYQTPMGPVLLDINGIEIVNNLNENGGNLSFEYCLNSGGMLISENTVNVNIKEIK